MHKAILAVGLATAMTLAIGGLDGCNNLGTCPAKGSITPGGTCSGDSLECAYDLATPSPACDGTNTVIPTSCTCTNGAWSCPSPVSCPSGGDDGGGDSSMGDDGGGGDASGG